MLEQSLVHSKRARNRLLVLPVAVALHAAAIAAAVAAAVWSVELPRQVPDQITTYSIGQIPVVPAPPPARRGRTDGSNPPTRVETPPRSDVAPAQIPDDVPDLPADQPAEGALPGASDGPAGGDPDGSDDGVIGGVGSGPPGGGVVQGPADRILRPGGDVTMPRVLARTDPVYPEIAREIRLRGIVVLECIIGRDGRVRDPRVARSAHPLLDRAAIDAVTQWRFEPATLNGQPVDVYFHLTVRFALR
ncbi:MAG: energy transducer TonB [Acidobacteria bacterium]|nr:energy transducer TonB [Acidobacteriota bacterium]